jgi:hypothetical protein
VLTPHRLRVPTRGTTTEKSYPDSATPKIVGIGTLAISIFHNTTLGIIQMKLTSFLATTILLVTVVTSTVSLPAFTADRLQTSAQEIKIAQTETTEEKISQIAAIKGKPGSGDLLRKLYEKDLTPIGIQPGGAGMVVNLYSKKNNTTLSLCTVYDVVVTVKKGKIAKFKPSEVK